MDRAQPFKQMLYLNKMVFDNLYNSVVMFQDQMESMAGAAMTQAPWIPEDGRKAMGEWVNNYKRVREDFKKFVDEGFDRMESFLAFGQQAPESGPA